jgi:hypothetical protein
VSTPPIRWKQPILTEGSVQPYILSVGGDISRLTAAAIASSRDILKDAVRSPVSIKRQEVIKKLYTVPAMVIKDCRTALTFLFANGNRSVLCLNRIASEYDKEDFLAIRYLAVLLRGSSFSVSQMR